MHFLPNLDTNADLIHIKYLLFSASLVSDVKELQKLDKYIYAFIFVAAAR